MSPLTSAGRRRPTRAAVAALALALAAGTTLAGAASAAGAVPAPGSVPAAGSAAPIVYAATPDSDSLSAIDTGTGTVSTIPLNGTSAAVAVSPDGATVYALVDPPTGDLELVAISAGTGTVADTIDLPGIGSTNFVLSPDGSTAYIVDDAATRPRTSIAVVDLATGAITRNFAVTVNGSQLFEHDVAISPDGTDLYLSGQSRQGTANESFVVVVNIASGEVVASIRVHARGAYGIAAAPDGAHVYVVGTFNHAFLLAIDTTTFRTRTIELSGTPYALALSPNGHDAYLPDENVSTLTTVDLANRAVSTASPAIGRAYTAAADSTDLFTSSNGLATVSEYDLGTGAVTTYSVGGPVFQVAVDTNP